MARGDVCCQNVNGDPFPCQGGGGGCCGNACFAPGSKCCKEGKKETWYPVSKETKCSEETSPRQSLVETSGSDRCGDGVPCGDTCMARGDVCCQNVNGDPFPCEGGGGGCCGNACFAPGSKCCKEGEKETWYPVSKETKCSEESSRLPLQSPLETSGLGRCGDGVPCGDTCMARGDVCCQNVNGDPFPCQGGGGGCCGNACFAPGSKCCKEGQKETWYPVSEETKCTSDYSSDLSYQAWHAPVGGVNHGAYQNDIDWHAMARMSTPDCGSVCRGDHDQCYPIKANGFMGTPCGVLSMGNPQGCFLNAPTQTCALCDTRGQPYCCPTSLIKRCDEISPLRPQHP